MDKVHTQNYRLLPIIIMSFMLFIGFLYSNSADANTSSQPPGTQLASYIGFHSYNRDYYRPYNVYYGHRYRHHNKYWRNWGYRGGCRKSCLIDSWSGAVIRCTKRC